jgi:hypothetical protein
VVFIYNGIVFSHRKNEILLFVGKWIELKNIILSEVSQVQKVKGHSFLSYMEYRPNTNSSNIIHACKYIENMYSELRLVEEIKEGEKE